MNLLSRLKPPSSKCCRLFLIYLFGITIVNAIMLNANLQKIRIFKKALDHHVVGYKFFGLEKFTKGIEYMGYYTDKDTKKGVGAKEFAQAQYVLAPTILELNNTNYEHNLFVCSTERVAWEKMKEIRALPLRRNKFGMILTKRQWP